MATRANSAHHEKFPRLLYDIDDAAEILSLSSVTVDHLWRAGWLRCSVTVGNRVLFSIRDLERFANSESPRKIDLRVALEAPGQELIPEN